MPNLIRDTAIAAALLFGAAACATPTQPITPIATSANLTGETVSNVVFENGGRLARTDEKKWTEYSSGDGQPMGNFIEVRHGKWSVTLDEVDSNKRLEIDLYKNTLSYEYDKSPQTFLYNITDATVDAPTPLSKYVSAGANGNNLVQANFQDGASRFEKSTDDIWLEYDYEGQAVFAFKETGRDENSVHLLDAARGIKIELNVDSEEVILSRDDGEAGDKWPITKALRVRDNLTD